MDGRAHSIAPPPWTEPEAQAISRVGGRFLDPALEAAFRRHVWPEWAARLRVGAIAAALIVLAFGSNDWLMLGWTPALWVSWSGRVAVAIVAFVVVRLTLGPPRIGRLDVAVLVMTLLIAGAVLNAVALTDRPVPQAMPSVIVIILGFFLIPLRFDIQLAASLSLAAGFFVIALTVLDPAPSRPDMITAALLILICEVLGSFTALRTHILHRREYLGLRQLEHRVKFEELVARLSTAFITMPMEQVNAAIQEALSAVGLFADVDRAYVFEFDARARQMSCSHEWCRPGVAPAMVALQHVSYADFSWAMHELLAGRRLVVESLAALPPEAEPERAELARHGARSVLVLPLLLGSEVVGAIGFQAVRREVSWTEESVAILRMAGEMIIGVLVRCRAERQLVQQTRVLEQSVAALERSNADLQQFAYVASHDLQEPLRSISSFSSLLAERYRGRMDAKADEYIGYLTGAASRMHALITDLLEYSRLDAGARPFVRRPAGDIVKRALENLRASLEESGAQVDVRPLPEIQGDPSQLVQLFQNLIGNALKFTDGGKPAVTVAAEREGESWRFRVDDNGIGIDPRHADRIFAIFTRLHSPERYPGTGIGLAVCKRIVERHRGRIWVEPNVPRGSSFRFTLPAAD